MALIHGEERRALRERFPEAAQVLLKSGSPLLTVEDVRQDGLVNVMWMDADLRVQREGFHPDALVRVA